MSHERGDRLNPPRTHHARHVLVRLAEAVSEAAASLPRGDGKAILDLGCGNMPYRPLLEARGWRYVGADLPGNAEAAVALESDGALPAGAGPFDAGCSFQVLEHVPDPRAYLARLHGALKPGAPLLLSTHGTWPYHPDPEDSWRWTRDGLLLELQRAGFRERETRAVLGPVSSGVQLVVSQLATRLPPVLSRAWCAVMQPVVAVAEHADGRGPHADAAVFLVTAERDSA